MLLMSLINSWKPFGGVGKGPGIRRHALCKRKTKKKGTKFCQPSLGDCEAQAPGHFALSSVGAVRRKSWGMSEGASLCLRDVAECGLMRQSLSVFQILSVTMEGKLVHLLRCS